MGKPIKVVRTLSPAAKKRFESLGANDVVLNAFIKGVDSYEVGVWESQVLRPKEDEPFRKYSVVMVHPALYKKNDESEVPVDVSPFCMESGRRGAVQTVLNYGKEIAWCILDVDLNERAMYELQFVQKLRTTYRDLATGLKGAKLLFIQKMMRTDFPKWVDASEVFDTVDLTPKKKKKLDPVLPAPEPKKEVEQVEVADEDVVEMVTEDDDEDDDDCMV